MSNISVSGRACWAGINGSLVTAELSTIGQLVPVALNHSRNVPGTAVEDGNGNTFAETFGDPQDSLEVTCIISDPSGSPSLSNVQANMKLPAAGSIVTLASHGTPLINGTWNAGRNCRIVPAGTDAWRATIPLTRKGVPSGGVPVALTPVT